MGNKDKTGTLKQWGAFTLGRGIRAGIVLGYTHLTIVIVRSHSDKEFEVIKWGKEPYGEGVTRKSPTLPSVVKGILSRYLKEYKTVNIWCMIQSKGVETRYMVLPDMASKHLPNAVFWSFKKEVEIGNQDVIFDFDVTGVRESRNKKELEVMACSAPVKEIQEIKELFKRTGWPLTGVTVTSFAFQNLFRTGFAGQGSRNIGTLFIGTDWSRIDIFSDGNLILSRDIKTGTGSMTEVIDEQVKVSQEEGISIDAYLETDEPLTHEIEDEHALKIKDNGKAKPIQANHFFDMIHEGDPVRLQEVFQLIQPVVDRLTRQIERTFEHFSMTFKGERVERLYFTGPLCAFSPLLAYTEKQLGVPSSTINPFEKDGEGKQKSTTEVIEQDDFVPSTGLALSGKERTLNFNFTYKDKNKQKWNRTFSQVLSLVLFLLAAIGMMSHVGFNKRESSIRQGIRVLSDELKVKETLYGKAGIMDLSQQIVEGKKRAAILAKTHQSAAALADLTKLIGHDIKITVFEYEETDMTPESGMLHIKGLVLNQSKQGLDVFIEKLSSSPLVKSVALTHVRGVEHKGKKGHYFESTLEFK